MECLMEGENLSIPMEVITLVISKTVFHMAKADSSVLMAGIMKVNWKTNRPKVKEGLFLINMGSNMKETGLLICLMGLEGKCGKIITLAQFMKDSFWTESNTERENIPLQISLIKAGFRRTLWTARVESFIKVEKYTRETSSTGRSTVMAFTDGLITPNFREFTNKT